MDRQQAAVHVVDQVRAIAKELGWGVGTHGSMVRDIDLIAVPWTNEACSTDALVQTLMERLGMTRWGTNQGKRAHGRRTFLLLKDEAESQQQRFNEGRDPGPVHPKGIWWPAAIDLSAMDPRETAPPTCLSPSGG
jgi:hypothetical protein